MKYREPKTCLLVVLVSAGMFACATKADSDSSAASASWDCSTNPVPNGETTSCVRSGLAVTDGPVGCGITYETLCPPDGTGGAAGTGGSSATGTGGNGETGTGGNGEASTGGNPAMGAGGTAGTGGNANAGTGGSTEPPPNHNWTCEALNGVVTCTQTNCIPDNTELPCGACVPTPNWTPDEDCVPPTNGGCWITGGGFIVEDNGSDNNFGGNGMPMKDGTIRGEWENVDHATENKMHGEVNYLVCRHVDEPGPGQPSGPSKKFDINQAYYGGPARWFTNGAWADGYWFDVMAEDHGEPGNKPGPGNHGSAGPDFYHITVRQMQGANQSGVVVYDVQGDFEGGNFQIHPPNAGHPYTAGTLPSWVQLQQ